MDESSSSLESTTSSSTVDSAIEDSSSSTESGSVRTILNSIETSLCCNIIVESQQFCDVTFLNFNGNNWE